MSVRRSTDSVYLQYIWNAIEANPKDSPQPTFNAILSTIQTNCDPKCTAAKLHHELSNAIRDGCVKNNQGYYSLVDGFELIEKDKSDWYCYECHGPGLVIPCPTCFRVYHQDCLGVASEVHWSCRLPLEDPTVGVKSEPDSELPPTYPCPVCRRLSRVSCTASSDSTSVEDLQKIFITALEGIRNRVHWKTMQKVGYLYEPMRNEYLVYRQINTKMIADRLRADPRTKNGYSSRTCLLVDLDNLVHNAAVFYGSKHAISNMARQIRSQLKRAMRESAYCIDCYLRPSTMSSVARLISPCRRPHRLLWFQHNGWSFRPCKMIYESSEGYEVVCFGGRHEREFVHRSRAFDMTFTAPELGLRMTPSLKKALDEAEEYKANQSAYDRNLPLSSKSMTSPQSFSQLTPVQQNTSAITSHSFSNGSSTPVTAISSSKRTVVSTRKRKAGPKYTTAFSSTDTESSLSVFSSSAPTVSSKRRKSAPVPFAGGEQHNFCDSGSRNKPTKAAQIFTDTSICSSVDSDPDYSEEVNGGLRLSTRPAHPFTARQSYESTGFLNQVASTQNINPPNDFSFGTDSSRSVPNSLPNSHSTTGSCLYPKVHDAPPPSSVVSKPVIRIKPLPLLKEQAPTTSSTANRRTSKSTCGSVTVDDVRTRAKCGTPSSSSALSVPSSGCATIPAVASLDELVSSESVFSSTSSSSNKVVIRSKKIIRPSKSNVKSDTRTDDSVSVAVSLSDSKRSSNRRSKSRAHSNPLPDVLKNTLKPERLSAPASAFNTRPSRRRQSPSSLSSLSESSSTTSSSSSSLSRSPSPTSSELSSSTLPSSSTVPSPARRLSFSIHPNEAIKPDGAFVRDPRFLISSTNQSRISPGRVTAVLSKTVVNDAATSRLFSDQTLTSVGDSTPSPAKSTQSNYSQLKHTLSSPDRPSSFSLQTSISLRRESDKDTKSTKKKSYQAVFQHGSDAQNTSPRQQQQLSQTSINCGTLQQHGFTNAFVNSTTKLGGASVGNTGWSSLSRLSSSYGNHTPLTHPQTQATSGPTPTGPTPPSSSSCSSSCYSSVSPAALSTTSGLGSSLSDPKSVDASPVEVAALLGNTSFSCPSSGHGMLVQPGVAQSDTTVLFKSAEEQIHRIYADRLATLTAERDQARDEVARRDALMNQLRREHEIEIKRVKQQTWCCVCLNKAFYHCCPGTAYCSEACQLAHWTEQHNRDCRRRGETQSST
ncbi:uncharacterized protein DEA37_0006251 [Paragonimus westermani]|uniref:MYND-type domain-containing protein n=1 Tax=Paragonimus westermani TaxID=34504 RepID=A0A5J4NHS5_9TREM|nr:uncharacterized protein DEA37_0006251 [Paragonimus westermani]